jgi:hypothetical protein
VPLAATLADIEAACADLLAELNRDPPIMDRVHSARRALNVAYAQHFADLERRNANA